MWGETPARLTHPSASCTHRGQQGDTIDSRGIFAQLRHGGTKPGFLGTLWTLGPKPELRGEASRKQQCDPASPAQGATDSSGDKGWSCLLGKWIQLLVPHRTDEEAQLRSSHRPSSKFPHLPSCWRPSGSDLPDLSCPFALPRDRWIMPRSQLSWGQTLPVWVEIWGS